MSNNQSGGIVWASEGRKRREPQGVLRWACQPAGGTIRTVSIDMSAGYERAITQAVSDAKVGFDRFVRHEALLVRERRKTPAGLSRQPEEPEGRSRGVSRRIRDSACWH